MTLSPERRKVEEVIWHTEDADLPDFNVHGFHTGKKVVFRLSDGREITGPYQGWEIFGVGNGYRWKAGEPHVTAWRPA